MTAFLVAGLWACTGQLGGRSATADGDPAAGDQSGDQHVDGGSSTGDPGQGDPGQGDPGQGDPGQGDPGGEGDTTPGTVLFFEGFEDTNWGARGWYDGSSGTLSSTAPVSGASAFECTFVAGAAGCSGGMPARVPIPETESVYLSFYIKHSDNWVGSGRSYHPHIFHFVTNEDHAYVGPANTHLTLYIESPTGRPMLGLQDSLNVDNNCILQNNDNIVGCNGDFATYPFTESRSAASCNGLVGFVDGRDCYYDSYWYSARSWHADGVYFQDSPGAYYKGDWHFIEAFFRLNTIQSDVGVPDGSIRYWYDGQLLISSDNILLRTAEHPDMAFNQFLFTPYIGPPGSPVPQTFWVDDLTIATGRP